MTLSGRKKNPKTSFITKHFKIFSFSLEHVTALPQIFLVAMGKKATLCMKYFKSACSMITSSMENACWIYYSQSLISAWICALKNGKREKEDGLVAPNAWPFLIFLDKRSIWVVKTNWTSLASAAIGCGMNLVSQRMCKTDTFLSTSIPIILGWHLAVLIQLFSFHLK